MCHLLFSVVLILTLLSLPPLIYGKTLEAANLTQLETAMKAARPGDHIVMADGNWRDVIINFSAEATAQRPVTLRAKSPGKVLLTGKSKLRLTSPYLIVDGLFFRDGMSEEGEAVIDFRSHDGRVTNTAVVNFNPPSDRVGYHWVYFTGFGNTLDHSLFEGKDNRRPVVANGCCESRRNRVESCYFKNIKHVSENGREVIQVQGIGRSDQYTPDGAFFVIENNLFEHADGEGAEIISIKSNFNLIRYNTIRATRGGITLRSGYSNTVEGNFIFGEGKAGTNGIRVQGHRQKIINNYIEGVVNGLQLHTGERLFSRGCVADYLTVDFVPLKRQEAPCGYVVHYGQVYDSTFAHNTFVNISGADITVGINYKSSWPQQQMLMIPESNLFVNNLIYKPSGGTAIVTQRPDTSAPFNKLSFKPNQFEGNLVYGGTLAISAPSSDASGFILADPRLSRRDGMFRPAPDSPAIDGGSERLVTHDIEGQRRNRQPDIGADEASRGPVRRRPLTAQDVGPEWMKSK